MKIEQTNLLDKFAFSSIRAKPSSIVHTQHTYNYLNRKLEKE